MMKQIKGLLYFYMTDIRYSLLIFWSILLGILVLSLAISYFLLSIEESQFYFGFPFGTYFFCIILGFFTVKESIPFALKVGATRKNLFISIGIFFFIIALIKAIIANSFQSLVMSVTDKAGLDTFHFLHPSVLLQDTWLTRVIMDTSILFLLLTISFLLGLFFYQAGLAGGGIVLGIIALALLVGIAEGWIFEFFINLFQKIEITFFYQLFGAGILLYCLSFLFLRKITIIKVK